MFDQWPFALELIVIIFFASPVVAAIAAIVAMVRFYHRVDRDQVLIIHKKGHEPRVARSGTIVSPFGETAEYMDVTVKSIAIERLGAQAVTCRDHARADVKARFFVSVNHSSADDVLEVARTIGCERASDPQALHELFAARLSEALGAAAGELEFQELNDRREELRRRVIAAVGDDLGGYALRDVAIESLERTPDRKLGRFA